MTQVKNLFEQLHRAELVLVGQLVGVDTVGPTFRNYLREIPPVEDEYTLGDVARAYLKARMEALK